MSQSMTGYGAGQRPLRNSTLTVEARSVNHRYLESSVRGPRWALPLEAEVREAVKGRFARGRFDIYIHCEEGPDGAPPIDPEGAKGLVSFLKNLRDELGLAGEVDLSLLAQFRDALRAADPTYETEELRHSLLGALDEALASLAAMRQREGDALERDLLGHLDEVARLLGEIRLRLPDAREELVARIRERLARYSEGVALDEGRLEQELVFAAERGDISEELSRLDSHIEQFRAMLGTPGSVGRKLDFLVQEMNREANTIGSKSGDLPLTQRAVDLKSTLEKIREQVQNLE